MRNHRIINILSAIMGFMISWIPQLTFAQQIDPEEAVKERSTITVPGTQVSIVLPNVFQYNDAKSAYIYSGAAASLTFRELNGTPYSSLIKGMTKQSLESQGMTLKESAAFTPEGGQKGMLYVAGFTVKSEGDGKSVEFERMIFCTGNENKSVWITANYPVITKSLLEPVLRECFTSVKF